MEMQTLNLPFEKNKMSLNASEARLSAMTRKTFLSMWSYENPFYKRGKELCDVLVVCGNDVIIISDKLNAFGDHPDAKVNWKRWYKKAIDASIRQLCGARNQLKRDPGKVYINAQVSSPLPLRLPSIDQMRIHLIAVANGCEEPCLKLFGRSSITINTQIKDSSEIFSVGTLTDDGDFIHIVGTKALDAIFQCFDTTRDFIDYLNRKKEALLREHWIIDGEENLVALYMMSQRGDRPFSIPLHAIPIEKDIRVVKGDKWLTYLGGAAHAYRQESNAREMSYFIDHLIEGVVEDYTSERMIIGQNQSISYHEQAFRMLASESRVSRQLLVQALMDIYLESTNTFWCNIAESIDEPSLYYLWLLYPPAPMEWQIEKLEAHLLNELTKYMIVCRSKFPNARRIFGICLPNRDCNHTSQIYRVIDGEKWTDEMQEAANKYEQVENILAETQEITLIAAR
ncbi:hypothetical protein [Undibacterium baiyunense]|nr:hypothetical protein [Undibacterium baiyunense]